MVKGSDTCVCVRDVASGRDIRARLCRLSLVVEKVPRETGGGRVDALALLCSLPPQPLMHSRRRASRVQGSIKKRGKRGRESKTKRLASDKRHHRLDVDDEAGTYSLLGTRLLS